VAGTSFAYLSEHGPGAIARNTRHPFWLAGARSVPAYVDEVEIRDLSLYEQLVADVATEAADERRTA
jgi:hypothetical protein